METDGEYEAEAGFPAEPGPAETYVCSFILVGNLSENGGLSMALPTGFEPAYREFRVPSCTTEARERKTENRLPRPFLQLGSAGVHAGVISALRIQVPRLPRLAMVHRHGIYLQSVVP